MGRCRAICGLIFCSIETILLSGIIFGWDFLLPLLQKDSIFSEEFCNTTSPSTYSYKDLGGYAASNNGGNNSSDNLGFYGINYKCVRENEEYDLVYMLAIFSPYVFILLMGVMYDYLGTRVVRILGIVLFIAGCMQLSFTTTATNIMLYIGMPMISAGGLLILITNIQISNWFFVQRSTVICWLVGCMCSSSGLFFLINFLEYSFAVISTKYLFWGLAGLSILPIITTFAILPFHHITEDANSLDNFTSNSNHININSKKIYRQTRLEGLTMEPEDKMDLEERRSSAAMSLIFEKETYCTVSCCALFILHVFWFAALQLQYWWIYHRSHDEIYLDLKNDNSLEYRYELFHYAPIAMLPLPLLLIGILMDCRRKSIGKQYPDSETIHVIAAQIPIIITTFIAACMAGFVFAPDWLREFKYAIDALLVIHKPMVLATSACFIFQTFPEEFFGRLIGVNMMVGGVLGVQYYTLNMLYETYVIGMTINWIDVGIAILIALAIAHPIHLIARGFKLREETERRTMNVIWATDNATYGELSKPNNWKSTEL